MWVRCLIGLLVIAPATLADSKPDVSAIYGRIQFVTSFPDYKVKVVDVRVVVRKGKMIRSSRGKRAQPALVSRKDTKKAYVRLAEGQKLDLFGEDEKKEEKK